MNTYNNHLNSASKKQFTKPRNITYKENTLNKDWPYLLVLPFALYVIIAVIICIFMETTYIVDLKPLSKICNKLTLAEFVLSLILSIIINKIMGITSNFKYTYVFFALILVINILAVNESLVKLANSYLDKGISQVRYVLLEKKEIEIIKKEEKRYIDGKRSVKKEKSENYYYYISSWVTNSPFKIAIKQSKYNDFTEKDVIKLETKPGYFNMEYIVDTNDFKNVNKSDFPPNAKFPLTEEEYKKLKK